MPVMKPLTRDSFDDYYMSEGADADEEVLDHAGGVGKLQIVTAGDGSSKVEVYDGTVAAGTKIAHISGVTIGTSLDVDVWCKTSIHLKVTDAGGTIVTRVSGFLR